MVHFHLKHPLINKHTVLYKYYNDTHHTHVRARCVGHPEYCCVLSSGYVPVYGSRRLPKAWREAM
jgi:hypothetical protein